MPYVLVVKPILTPHGSYSLAVRDGSIDVGFLRTGKLQTASDSSGPSTLDESNFKIIAERNDVLLNDGSKLPFPISTRLYPEWSFSSYAHVSEEVRSTVQASLVNILNHAAVAPVAATCNVTGCEDNMSECLENCVVLNALSCRNSDCDIGVGHLQRCDTTPEIALTAEDALMKGNYAGFRTSLSYASVHNLLEESGLLDDQTGTCAKPPYSTDAINCPEGFFQREEDEIPYTCRQLDLDCLGFDCICSPCRKAFEVDFFPINTTAGVGCAKFDVCGSVEQNNRISFILVDNMRRDNATFSVKLTDIKQDDSEAVTLKRLDAGDPLAFGVKGTHVYSFLFEATHETGFLILQVFADDGLTTEQISQSPFRLAVNPRDCPRDTGDPHRIANVQGECLCDGKTMTIANNCVAYSTVFYFVIPILFLIIFLTVFYIHKMKSSGDNTWRIPPDDLVYRDPPRTLGRGTFGLVLLAEYKGESVAVKRALPNGNELPKGSFEKTRAKRRSVTRSSSGKRFDYNNDVESFISSVETAQSSQTQSSNRMLDRLGHKKKTIYGLKGDLIKEARFLSRLHHPCITTVLGTVVDIGEPLLVLEHVELGCLHDILHNESMVIEGELALSILSDVACGMNFLHSKAPKVIHGDLRARNVLINDRFQAKITNYGFTQKRKNARSILSPQWKAPEILLGESDYTTASDVYSFGMVFYEVFSRKDPYYDENFIEIFEAVVDSSICKRPPVPGSCPQELVSLMESCLAHVPNARPSAETVDGTINATKTQARTNNLLLDVFPKHVAETIQLGQTVVPEVRDSVSVLFAGVAYERPDGLDTSMVSDAIRRLFATLDELCNKHNVLRVKTVGETFMAVTNLAESQDDHEAKLALFALAAIEVASKTLVNVDDPRCGTLSLRCGFHSGPVLAHMVGSHTPRYTIIGETVNTASKIEEFGKPGILHCSEDTAGSLLGRSDLKVSFLGPVCVDDMGEVVVFSVSKKADQI